MLIIIVKGRAVEEAHYNIHGEGNL